MTPSNPPAMLEVEDLRVDFRSNDGTVRAVDGIDFSVLAGSTLGIVGESGSGKSVTSLAIMGLLPRPAGRMTSGRIRLNGRELSALPEKTLRNLRGAELSMIFQEPMTALNPVFSVGRQMTSVLKRHQSLSGQQARAQAIEMLKRVKIANAERRIDDYPHQLSGGMRQRVMIAMALACRPKLLIADEPTTALDVTTQAQVLELINELKAEFNTTVLLITHDLGVIANTCEQAVVMRQGQIVERGPVDRLFKQPEHAYTQQLINAIPRIQIPDSIDTNAEAATDAQPLLRVENLSKQFQFKSGWFTASTPPFKAVDQVSFRVEPGQTLGIVGESGSGKTTLGRMIVRLIEPSDGRIWFDGVDLRALNKAQLKQQRKHLQIVFQDPFASLSPRRTVLETLLEPLAVHAIGAPKQRRQHALKLLDQVELPGTALNRYPHEFSGGQRQRIAIARALAVEPKLIVADEAVSALDVSVQAKILQLIETLQQELGVAFVFISHDLAVVQAISHRVGVMYRGQLVEQASVDQLYSSPQHPHTQALLDAVPRLER